MTILQVAYPLLTLLTCLEDDASFKRNIEVQTEQMSRQLRVQHTLPAPALPLVLIALLSPHESMRESNSGDAGGVMIVC